MSSFFTVPASERKRKRADDRTNPARKRRDIDGDEAGKSRASAKARRSKPTERDESISGSESEDEIPLESGSDSEATSEEGETAADRRVRLAKRYLDNLREEINDTAFNAEDIDKDLIAQRLKEDADEVKGRQYRLIALGLDFTRATHCTFRTETQSTTAVATCPPYAYTVSKDMTLIKWELPTPLPPPQDSSQLNKATHNLRRRPKKLERVQGIKINASFPQQQGHTGPILSLAVSPDGRYVATGGADKKLIIWSAANLTPLKTFPSHRDAVTGLAFAPTSSQPGVGAQLFSASMDRTLKTYSLNGDDSLAYVETLFGHQDHVTAVVVMNLDQCVSVGARDRTARLWKVVDETQLVFRGESSKHDVYSTGSVDCVAALPPAHFVTGTDSGALQLWSIHKKKPLFTLQTAHGIDQPLPMEEARSEKDPEVIARLKKEDTRKPSPRAITALASLPGTDVVLSGSWDGWVRVWKVSDDKRMLISLGVVGKTEKVASNGNANGMDVADQESHTNGTTTAGDDGKGTVPGIINSIAVFERRRLIRNEFGGVKEGECQGLCVVAGTGKEMRLGRWMKMDEGRNGAVVFEVPLTQAQA